MKWLARIVFGLLAAIVGYVALRPMLRSGNAPRFVAVAYDRVTRLVSDDPHTRCYLPEEKVEGTTLLAQLDPRDCYDWEPPRLLSGIYIDEFEGQQFLEGARQAKTYVAKDEVWIEIDGRTDVGPLDSSTREDGKSSIWHIRFVGRKTVRPGRYGHMGAFSEEVLVDRIVSAELLTTIEGYLPETILKR